MNESPTRSPAEARRRGLLLLWGAQFFTLALLYILTYVFRPQGDGNHTAAWVFGIIGVMTFLLSFPLKRKLLSRAAAEHRFDLATTAYVVAFIMCEATGIIGFVSYIVTGLSYALHSFIIAVAGLLLHFPKRDALDWIEPGATTTTTTTTGANFKSTL